MKKASLFIGMALGSLIGSTIKQCSDISTGERVELRQLQNTIDSLERERIINKARAAVEQDSIQRLIDEVKGN